MAKTIIIVCHQYPLQIEAVMTVNSLAVRVPLVFGRCRLLFIQLNRFLCTDQTLNFSLNAYICFCFVKNDSPTPPWVLGTPLVFGSCGFTGVHIFLYCFKKICNYLVNFSIEAVLLITNYFPLFLLKNLWIQHYSYSSTVDLYVFFNRFFLNLLPLPSVSLLKWAPNDTAFVLQHNGCSLDYAREYYTPRGVAMQCLTGAAKLLLWFTLASLIYACVHPRRKIYRRPYPEQLFPAKPRPHIVACSAAYQWQHGPGAPTVGTSVARVSFRITKRHAVAQCGYSNWWEWMCVAPRSIGVEDADRDKSVWWPTSVFVSKYLEYNKWLQTLWSLNLKVAQ